MLMQSYKSLILTPLAVSLLLTTPVFAQNSAQLENQVSQQIAMVSQKLGQSSPQQILKDLAVAQQRLNAFKASKDVKSLDENKWRLTRELEQDLILLQLEAAETLMNRKAFKEADQVLKDSGELQPYLPVTMYLKGLNYLQQGKEWEATEQFYEAKRYNRYPALRKVENPNKPWEVLMANPTELEMKVDAILQSLGKDTEYPLSLNFSTGKHEYLKLVPGVGANLMGRDGTYFDVYLKDDMINKVLNNMGRPANVEERFMRGQMLHFYPYDDFYIIGVNPENKIERIQIDRPGYSVRIHDASLVIGQPASEIKKVLAEGHGFERITEPNGPYVETWVYNDYGLSFGITKDQKIGLVSIWTLE